MGELRGISGKEAIRRLAKLGYIVVRQRGSHVRLRNKHPNICLPIIIPMHRELKIGLLIQIIKDAGISIDEFKNL